MSELPRQNLAPTPSLDPIAAEVARFEAFMARGAPGIVVEKLCDYALLLRPKAAHGSPAPSSGKQVALTLLGLTHGNEFAGAAVVNGFLELLTRGQLNLQVPVAVALGNPWAAIVNKRFLDKDLNRSFGRLGGASREGARASALEPLLADTELLLDFHQTSQPCDRAFFIFPYNAGSYAFARAVAPQLTVVTHWGKPFSKEGMCTDEFVIRNGGTGISLELGQNGLDHYQIALGIQAALGAVAVATHGLGTGQGLASSSREPPQPWGQLYTWAQIVPWPEAGQVELDPGWRNFQLVEAEQRLGTVDGRVLRAEVGGRMLFPKYLSPAQQQDTAARPTELCRLLRPIVEAELPAVASPS